MASWLLKLDRRRHCRRAMTLHLATCRACLHSPQLEMTTTTTTEFF
jgi:hypothetical protein